MSADRVVDLSRRPLSPWLPRVDDLGRPSEARLYVDLVRSAGLRLSVALDGTPRLTVTDDFRASGVRMLRVPSPELTAYLDGFQRRRGQASLDQELSGRFIRLVRTRCASPDFAPDPPRIAEAPARVVPRSLTTSEYDGVRDLVTRLADPSVVGAFIRHRARLSAEIGLRVLTVPVGARGRVFVLERSDRSGESSPPPSPEAFDSEEISVADEASRRPGDRRRGPRRGLADRLSASKGLSRGHDRPYRHWTLHRDGLGSGAIGENSPEAGPVPDEAGAPHSRTVPTEPARPSLFSPDPDRGAQDLLSDPGNRDLDHDGGRRDLRGDPGLLDLVQDPGVQDSLKLGAILTGRLPSEIVLTAPLARSGAFMLTRQSFLNLLALAPTRSAPPVEWEPPEPAGTGTPPYPGKRPAPVGNRRPKPSPGTVPPAPAGRTRHSARRRRRRRARA